MGRLDSKVAVIRGATRGVGRGIALRFAREGARIIIIDEPGAQAGEVLAALGQAGAPATCVTTDMGVKEQADLAIAQAMSAHGRIDILVNAIESDAPFAPLETRGPADFARTMAREFHGTLWAMQAVLPAMRGQGGGSILNVVSTYGDSIWRQLGDYAAASEAVKAITRTAAEEWGPYGILVNALMPAADTGAYRRHREQDPEAADRIVAGSAMGRLGDPERDIGGAAMFLVTDAGRFITGHMVFADGGQHLTPTPYEALLAATAQH